MEYEKLPNWFKKTWVTALRSGKYKQGTGDLKSVNDGVVRYCCLGVAGEICGCKNIEDKNFLSKGNRIVGLSNAPKELTNNKKLQEELAKMNDGDIDGSVKKHSFKKIANWIEKNL